MLLKDLPKSGAFYFLYYENTIVLYDNWAIKKCRWQQAIDYEDKLIAPNDWKYICTLEVYREEKYPHRMSHQNIRTFLQ